MLNWIPIVGTVLDKVFGIIDEAIEDKDLKTRIKAELNSQSMVLTAELDKKAADIIIAEAKGESWIQRSWRPILMLSVISIIINNYLLVPYLSIFTDKCKLLELPGELYTLLTIGVGGYVIGRSGEKIVASMGKKKG